MFAITFAAVQEAPAPGHFLTGVPHDAPAIAVYVLLVLVAFFLWYGNRPHGEGPTDGSPGAGDGAS